MSSENTKTDLINFTDILEQQAELLFYKTAVDFDGYILFLEQIKNDYDIHTFINGKSDLISVVDLKPLSAVRKVNGEGVKFLTKRKGVNIVVYDSKNNKLIDSVCFDLLSGAVWRNNKKIAVVPYIGGSQLKENVEEMRTTLKQGNAVLQQKFFEILDGSSENKIAARKQFHSNIPKSTGKLRLKQLIVLYNLSIFDKLCKRLDIQYSIFYGTLLGAWRASRFIPWDDDIDVIIFRDGFVKLWEYGDSKQFDDLPRVKFNVNNTSNLGIGRFRVTDMEFSFDVFPYGYSDEGPDTHKSDLEQFKKAHYKEMVSRMGADFRKDRTKVFEAWNDLFDKISAKFNPNGEGKFIIGSLGGGGTYMYPADILFPLSEIEFEGLKLSAPNDIEAINVLSFKGDHYALPPDVYQQHKSFNKVTFEKIKKSVNAIEILDFEFYQKYLKEEWERFNQ